MMLVTAKMRRVSARKRGSMILVRNYAGRLFPQSLTSIEDYRKLAQELALSQTLLRKT